MKMLKELIHILFENRTEYIVQKQGPALLHAYQMDQGRKPKAERPEEIIELLQKIDPTTNPKFLKTKEARQAKLAPGNFIQWIANRYAKQEFSLEDSKRVHDDILAFIEKRPTLDQKDINQYNYDKLLKTLQVSAEAEQTQGPTRPKFTPTQMELFDKGEAQMVYEDPQLAILIPKTKNASKKFQECLVSGQKIRWCTTQDYQHEHYTKQGPLYIVITPTEMAQFHFESGQFMDINDRPISLGPLVQKYPKIAKVFKDLAEHHGVLGLLETPSEKAIISAVAKNPQEIKNIQPAKLTTKIINAAVEHSTSYSVADIYKYVLHARPDLVDESTKIAMLSANPKLIKEFVPATITAQHVAAAMKGKQEIEVIDAFHYIEKNRPDLVDDKIRIEALKRDGRVIESIGKKATQQMIDIAVQDNAKDHIFPIIKFMMAHMPEKVSEEALINAVKQSRFVLRELPENRQTEKIIKASVEADPGSFVYVANPSDEALTAAIMSGPFIIPELKQNAKVMKRINTELFLKVADHAPKQLIHEFEMFDTYQHLPKNVDIDKVYERALSKKGEALQYINKKRQTLAMIKAAVKNNPVAWKYADKSVIAKYPELRAMARDVGIK